MMTTPRAPRPAPTRRRPRRRALTLALTPGTLARWTRAASARGITVTELVERCVYLVIAPGLR